MNKFIYTALLLCTILACKSKAKEGEIAAEEKIRIHGDTIILNKEQIRNADIQLSFPGEQNLRQTLQASGLADVPPQSLVSVSAPMGGYLKSTRLMQGMRVAKGQVIAVLEDPSYVQLQEDYLSARAKMQYAKADMERQKDLRESNATSTKSYQLALSEYNQLQVQIQSLAEKLRIINIRPESVSLNNITRRVNIYAPISGFVSKVNVNIGKYVNASEVMFELTDPNDLHAAINIFEKDIMRFKPGMKGTVWVSNDPDKKYPVSVLLVSKNLNDNRSAVVYCQFLNASQNLIPGMFLNAEFDVLNYQSKAVPEHAVVHFEGNDYVFLANNDSTFVMTAVQTGTAADGFVSLKTDSLFTKRIVINGAFNLLGAMKGGEGE